MLDAASFKQAMGSFPTGVTIAATIGVDGKPAGLTVSSFASVSLEPPLVLFCPSKKAECHDAFRAAEHFAVSILPAGEESLAQRFSTRGVHKFQGDEFIEGEHGLPLVRSAVASLVCRKSAEYEAGDHMIVVGEVLAVRIGAHSDSMVYYRRSYWRFATGAGQLVRST